MKKKTTTYKTRREAILARKAKRRAEKAARRAKYGTS